MNELKKQIGPIEKTSTITYIKENENITYDFGDIYGHKKSNLKNLTIWNKEDGVEKRELEIYYGVDETILNSKEIDHARNRWMAECNKHNAFELVKNVYARDALYFNHKPLVVGTDDIAKEYSYMNHEDYNLTLTPIIVASVNSKTVFEIGQCSGSYPGKYVLIWKKEKNGEWKVFLDSNI